MRLIRSLCGPFLLAACALASLPAWSEDWPARPIRVVVPYPPGAFSDTVTRIVTTGLAQRLGATVVVDNKGGANGMLGVAEVSRAAPDGYTFAAVIPAYVVSQHLYTKLPFDPAQLVGVASLASTPLVLAARKDAPFTNVKELIAYAKANPGKLTYGSSGIGSAAHLNSVLFSNLTGIRMTHVPYKGSAAALQDLMGQQIDVFLDTPLSLSPAGKAGKVRLLGVASAERMALMPDVPTLVELGVPAQSMTGSWVSMLAPKGTPPGILDRMAREIEQVVSSPAVVEQFAKLGVVPMYKNVADFNAYLGQEHVTLGRMVEQADIKPE